MGIKRERNELGVHVRLNHVVSNQRGDYSTITVEDEASGLQILEIELTPKQLYDMIANRGSGREAVPAVMPVQSALPWIGQKAWHFSRRLGWEYKADDPAVKAWAAELRDRIGLHSSSVNAHNYGAAASWDVYSNSITEDTAKLYREIIETADLPPKSSR